MKKVTGIGSKISSGYLSALGLSAMMTRFRGAIFSFYVIYLLQQSAVTRSALPSLDTPTSTNHDPPMGVIQ